jgi:hypothetical protein
MSTLHVEICIGQAIHLMLGYPISQPVFRIRILRQWVRIRIRNPDPDPGGGQK